MYGTQTLALAFYNCKQRRQSYEEKKRDIHHDTISHCRPKSPHHRHPSPTGRHSITLHRLQCEQDTADEEIFHQLDGPKVSPSAMVLYGTPVASAVVV